MIPRGWKYQSATAETVSINSPYLFQYSLKKNHYLLHRIFYKLNHNSSQVQENNAEF